MMAKKEDQPLPNPKNTANWKNFVAGGAGGCMGTLITCPLEVVKTRYQGLGGKTMLTHAQAQAHVRTYTPEIMRALTAIWAKEGVRGLFKGLVPNIAGVAPSRALYFGVYSVTKAELINSGFKEGSAVHLSSAVISGGAVATITSPVWLVKTRMQLQSSEPSLSGHTNYKNSFDCAKRVFREEGIRGFYKGLGASYLGVSEGSINFVLYEKFKSMALASRANSLNPEVSNTEYLLMAGCAKLIASMLTYPHEVIRTRLREQRAPMPGQQNKYQGIVHAFKLIAKEEGIAGLYGGMSAHLLRVVPNAAIMFWTYELIIKYL